MTARQGWVDGARVWREPVLGDDRVFLRQDQEPKPGFSVDLLLDGSASRLHCQGDHRGPGVYPGQEPAELRHSRAGHQLLQPAGLYGAAGAEGVRRQAGERRIFDYFAAGWNRDGLALRGMEELMQSAPAEKHLLLILTDANPDDSHRIPPTERIPSAGNMTARPGWRTPPTRCGTCAAGVSGWPPSSWGSRTAFRRRTGYTERTWPVSGGWTSWPRPPGG
ncbi:MAG: hypothetical protein ACLR5H_07180 [Oscillospiraceae bacterium]